MTGRIDRTLVAVLALGIAAALVPIWVPRFLPLLDFPNHLAEIAIWTRYHDPSWGYQRYYALGYAPVPYWLYYATARFFAFFMPVEIANKLFLSLYAAAVPISVAAAARRFGRSPWLAVLSLPFIFQYSFAFGFITCAAGLPLFFVGMIVLDRALERATVGRVLALFFVTVAIYFTHIFVWLTFGLCAGALLLLNAGAIANALWAAVAMVPSLAFATWNFRFANQHGLLKGHDTHHWVTVTQGLDHLIGDLPERLILHWPGKAAIYVLLVLLISWLAIYLTAPPNAKGGRSGAAGVALEVLVVVVTAAYLTVPFSLKRPVDCWNVGPRLAPLAALLILLLPRGEIAGWRRWLLAPALFASLLYPLAMKDRFVQFNHRVAGLVDLMDHVPRGSSTLVLPLGEKTDPDIAPEVVPYNEMQALVQVLTGGYNAMLFVYKGFPVTLKPGWPKTPPWNHPDRFDPAEHTAGFDYLLTQNEAGDGRLLHGYYAPLLGHEGPWRLYKLHVPQPDP